MVAQHERAEVEVQLPDGGDQHGRRGFPSGPEGRHALHERGRAQVGGEQQSESDGRPLLRGLP